MHRISTDISVIKDKQMASKHVKICSTSLAIKKMQTEITMRSHFIPLG